MFYVSARLLNNNSSISGFVTVLPHRKCHLCQVVLLVSYRIRVKLATLQSFEGISRDPEQAQGQMRSVQPYGAALRQGEKKTSFYRIYRIER